ncbi:MAG: hypothetical protein D6712_17275, partial [Chloroflexi bacterium]
MVNMDNMNHMFNPDIVFNPDIGGKKVKILEPIGDDIYLVSRPYNTVVRDESFKNYIWVFVGDSVYLAPACASLTDLRLGRSRLGHGMLIYGGQRTMYVTATYNLIRTNTYTGTYDGTPYDTVVRIYDFVIRDAETDDVLSIFRHSSKRTA